MALYRRLWWMYRAGAGCCSISIPSARAGKSCILRSIYTVYMYHRSPIITADLPRYISQHVLPHRSFQSAYHILRFRRNNVDPWGENQRVLTYTWYFWPEWCCSATSSCLVRYCLYLHIYRAWNKWVFVNLSPGRIISYTQKKILFSAVCITDVRQRNGYSSDPKNNNRVYVCTYFIEVVLIFRAPVVYGVVHILRCIVM